MRSGPCFSYTFLKSSSLSSRCIDHTSVGCSSLSVMYKLAAPSWSEFSDKQQFPWHLLHLSKHWDPTLRYAGPQASPSRQVGPYTPSLSGWPPLKIHCSKACNSELKAFTETQPHRIPRKTMRFLLIGKFHLICAPKCWFFWCSWQFSRATQFKTSAHLFNKNLSSKMTEFLEVKWELL